MNKKLNKKGFTIVELVIVIVVIAILAAVLIPTFIGLNRKAKIAADTALARELNNAIAMSETDVDTFEEALAALRDGGFLIANLNAKASGCYFVWEDKTNQIIYVDAEDDFKVIYSNGEYEEIGSTWYLAVSSKAKADEIIALNSSIAVKMTISNTKDLNTAINASGENTVYIDESIVISKNSTIVMNNSSASTTIKLGNATVSGNNNDTLSIENVPFQLRAGELTLSGGIVTATGNALDADGEVMNNVINSEGGVLNIEGTKIQTAGSTLAVALSSTTANIKDAELIGSNNVIGTFEGSNVVVENTKVECEYLAVFASSSGGSASNVTIKDGTYHSTLSNLLGVHGGVITVEDGKFDCDTPEKTFKFYNVEGSKIVLKGGTFNGVAFDDLTDTKIDGWINKTDIGSSTVTVEEVEGAWVLTLVK